MFSPLSEFILTGAIFNLGNLSDRPSPRSGVTATPYHPFRYTNPGVTFRSPIPCTALSRISCNKGVSPSCGIPATSGGGLSAAPKFPCPSGTTRRPESGDGSYRIFPAPFRYALSGRTLQSRYCPSPAQYYFS